MTPNPYGADLGDREPLDALADTPGRIRELVQRWSEAQFERSYAEGKWSARQVLMHLAQTELALTARARFALSEKDYQAQSFSQDDWVPLDAHASAEDALNAYTSLRQFNLAMWRIADAGAAGAALHASRVRDLDSVVDSRAARRPRHPSSEAAGADMRHVQRATVLLCNVLRARAVPGPCVSHVP